MDMNNEKRESQQEENLRDIRPDPSQLTGMEKFYEQFRGVSLRQLDLFIGGCIVALVLVVLVGMLKGWGIL